MPQDCDCDDWRIGGGSFVVGSQTLKVAAPGA
jgi:hypothetical protein